MISVISPEEQGSVDEKLGLVSIDLGAFAATRFEALTSPSPIEPELSVLPLVLRTYKRDPSGKGYHVRFRHDGALRPDQTNGEEFSMEGSTSEDPIETHKDIGLLLKIYGGGVKPDPKTGKIAWPMTLPGNSNAGTGTDDGQVFSDGISYNTSLDQPGLDPGTSNELFGTSSYLVPGCTWTRTISSLYLPPSLARQLGTIDNPPIGMRGQRPPDVDGGRNWLKVRATAQWRGNIWKVTESWLMSGPRGWNQYIYRR